MPEDRNWPMSGCAYVESRLRPLLDGELNAAEQRKVLSHLDRCAGCRAGYARMQSIVQMVQEQPLEDVPPHFSASLQVRLARHRTARAEKARRKVRLPEWSVFVPGRLRWAGAVTALVTLGACFAAFQNKSAADVVREAEQSWRRIRNYGGEFFSEGVYQGKERQFRQRQFFRRGLPGSWDEFTLETEKDYPLTTFVKADRMIHYIPGGKWEGKEAPLVIVRPRGEVRDALPFPYGVTWNSGGNVSLEQLIRQLRQNSDVRLLGTDRVGEQDCFHLQYAAVPPGGARQDQYEVWIDKETFLPRRVSWYRDEANHTITTAQFLQVNYQVLPGDTFDFQPPNNSLVIRGDIDPHVVALPFLPKVAPELLTDPVRGARYEGWERTRSMPFPAFSPAWLPEGFKLQRVRARSGSWVETYWVRAEASGPLQVLKLVEQDGSVEPGPDLLAGEQVSLIWDGSRVIGRMVTGTVPYSHTDLSWRARGTRFLLCAADLEAAEVRRIAASMVPVEAPPAPAVAERPERDGEGESRGEPSIVPTDVLPVTPAEPVPALSGTPSGSGGAPVITEQPPMMPEMSDEERRQ